MKFCQLVMGPAGAGKSTFCSTLMTHLQSLKRRCFLMNLDPAADCFEFEPTIDIRNLIELKQVMEELSFGPNGGLIYCLEHLIENIDWLEDELHDYEDDYLIIDCPGQIELYTHFDIMKQLVGVFSRLNYRVCGVYLLDCHFIQDPSKFFAGVMSCMSAMLQLGIPHVNVLSKMDLIEEMNPALLERYLDADSQLLLESINSDTATRFHHLNAALVRLIDEYSMVNFVPLNIKEESSIDLVLYHIDHALQFGEEQEPKEPADEFQEEE